MNKYRQFTGMALAAVVAGAAAIGAYADETNGAPAGTVDQRIDALDQEIRILKRQRELDQEQAQQKAAQAAKETAILRAGPDGFSLRSADSNFVLRIRGYAQADTRFYLHDEAKLGTDSFLMRRVRPILEGTLYHDFDFRLMPDFGNGASSTTILQDAYLEWRYWKWLKIRAGKYKPVVGLEQQQSDTDLLFIERGLPSDLIPNRDVGLQVSGDLFGGTVNYAAGIFNGVVDGGISDFDTWDSKDFAGRIFFQPFKTTDISLLKGFGFGAGGTVGNQQFTSTTTNLPTYKTTGQLTFFQYRNGVANDGEQLRGTPQAYYYYGPFNVLGEYTVSEQDVRVGTRREEMRNTAWQVMAGVFLTGETAAYRGSPFNPGSAVTPKRAFNLAAGGWGAVELVGRYGDLRVDPNAFSSNPTAGGLRFADPTKSAQEARQWGIGVNWYLNKAVKLSLNYEETRFDGGAGTTSATTYTVKDRETERALFTQAQFSF